MKLKARAYLAAEEWRKKYDLVFNFHDGLAEVQLNDKYGYVNTEGVEVVPPKYDYIYAFTDGLAKVSLDDKYGFIDKNGKEIVEPKYSRAYNFETNGLAEVSVNVGGSLREGMIDRTGKEVIPLGLYSSATNYLNCIVVKKKIDTNIYYGLLDITGKELTPFKYRSIISINPIEDPVIFKCGIYEENDILYGLINEKGLEIVPFGKYTSIDFFYQGLSKVSDKKYNEGFMDTTGEEVIPIGKYAIIKGDFEKGLPLAAEKGSGRYIHIDKKGNPFNEKYNIEGSFFDGFAVVELNGKRGFIDAKGEIAISLKYDRAWRFSEGFAVVELNGKQGFINDTGKEVVPPKYDYVDEVSDSDLVRVNNGCTITTEPDGRRYPEGGKWGYVNKQGVVVVPVGDYNYLGVFAKGSGRAQIKKGKWIFATGGEWILINEKGEQVTPESYSYIKRFDKDTGNYIVQKNDTYGRLDSKGEEVVPSKFKSEKDIIKFENALAAGASKERILNLMMPETQETK